MTIKQLIEKLSKFDEHLTVSISVECDGVDYPSYDVEQEPAGVRMDERCTYVVIYGEMEY